MKKLFSVMMLTLLYNAIQVNAFAQQTKAKVGMTNAKLNAGIITKKLSESKEFYTKYLGFKIIFENEWYVLMALNRYELAFMLPNQATQKSIFQSEFSGKGIFLTLEVDNVNSEYERIKKLKLPIEVELRDEPWGDRHFAVVDPNGIGVDIVTHKSQ